jgi:hypothetical protein
MSLELWGEARTGAIDFSSSSLFNIIQLPGWMNISWKRIGHMSII